MNRYRELVIVGFVAWLAGCGGGNDSPAEARGTIVSVESLGSYPALLIRQLLDYHEAPVSLEPRFGVNAYRIVYRTVNAHGDLVQASGAILLPVGPDNLPLISLQHPTQTKRAAVASEIPLAYGPDAVAAASFGYAACAPDYLGMGASSGMHPYVHAESAANAVMDFVRACRAFCGRESIALNGQLFLAGYSEGAHATMAAQRAMEAEAPSEFPITAVACLSGPYDLEQIAATMLNDPSQGNVEFLSYVLVAYNDIYGWDRLDEIFSAPYAGEAARLFDGSYSLGDIDDALPETVGELISGEFRASYANGTATDVIAAVRENSLLNWRPVAPVRLYHGTADDLVPFGIAMSAAASLGSQPGTSVELYPVNGAGHEEGILASLNPTFLWFEGLRK